MADLQIAGKSGKVHGVGMHPLPVFRREDHFGPLRTQCLPKDPVGAVSYPGFAQGTVQGDLEGIRLWVPLQECFGGPFRAHGVGGRGAFSNFINFTDGFHTALLRF